MTPSFAVGAVLIVDASGKIFRLSWEDENQKERKRFLPPGKYAVRGYRLYRSDKSGKEWIVSASGDRIKELTIEPHKETKLQIDESIEFGSGTRASANKLDLMMHFWGENKSGATVYANGKRISVLYRVLNARSEEIASGKMNYG